MKPLTFTFNRLDRMVRRLLGGVDGVDVYTHNHPAYRFVDFYRAAAAYADRHAHRRFRAAYQYHLSYLLFHDKWVKTRPADELPIDVDYDQQEYFPSDTIWFVETGDRGNQGILVRMRIERDQAILEIAARQKEIAEQVTHEIQEWAVAHSIYRNKVIEVPYEPDVPDEFGDIPMPAQINLRFLRIKRVETDDIILSDHIRQIIERNVIDFHKHHELLARQGIPKKRALLFHGPPGTGKTFTSQYLYNRLEEVTTFVVTGQSLHKMTSICNLARMLQPSLVILEDVDLAFASRDISLYTTPMGDFMDQLDGFRSDDRVTFILTTNALDRLEKAIKDRPGRINQCVYFGPPTAGLRKRYLDMYLRPFGSDDVDVAHVVKETHGTTQAFLKELVHRSVMVALEEGGFHDVPVQLATDHFDAALSELTEKNGEASQFVIGFRAREEPEE